MRAWWLIVVAACSSGAAGEAPDSTGPEDTADIAATASDTGALSDVGSDTVLSGDVPSSDVPSSDVPMPPDTSDDVASSDVSDVEQPACGALAATYNAEAAALNQCTQGADCEWVTHPVCGAGCAVAVNAAADHSALEAAWQAFSAAGCVPDPVQPTCCDLAPAPWGFGCSAGKCTPCAYQCAMDCTCKKDAAGCDLPECEAEGCPALTQAVDDAVAANDSCTTHADCARFEHPICGTIGCYQRAIATDAPIETLSTLAQAAQNAGCEPFHCGCGPVGEPLCLGGTCTLCPGGPGCPTTCDTIRAALEELAATGGACTTSTDCSMVSTPFCGGGKGLGCYALAVSGYTAVNAAEALLNQFEQLKCPGDDCDCAAAEVPICKDGACTPFYYVQ